MENNETIPALLDVRKRKTAMRFRPIILLFLGQFVFVSCTSTAPTTVRDAGAPDAGPETSGFLSLEVSPEALNLEPGQQELIQAFGIADDGTRKIVQDPSWVSDNESVVVVNAEGIVSAVDAGATEVHALWGDLRATVQIRVVADLDELPPRGLSYKSPVTYIAGQAIDPNTPNHQGGVPTRYQITPSLPAGLFIDAESGVISGTPRIPATRVLYTVTASNAGGSAVALVSLEVECDLNAPPSPSEDVPDALLQDSNGDGIDGVVCGPIFVATDGNDGAIGTIDAPVQTLTQAILLAKSYEPPRPIYVSKGQYDGRLTLSSGVHIYGGFDRSAGWSRDIESWPVVRASAPALLAENLEVSSTISQMEFQADDTSAGSATSYAALIQDCAAELRFERVVFRAGRGGDGSPGSAGWDGFWGEDATYGDSGCEPRWELGLQFCGSDPPCERPWYGQAGGSESESGSGGSGGYAGLGDEPGQAGSAGAGGASGGAGGVESVNLGRGGDGQAGAQGAHGMNGAGGSSGQPGADGADGRPGEGGGGGGGGAGNGDYCDAYGGAGGGGGSGGEPGEGGQGGSAGGASIALVVQNTDIHLENVRLVPGAGGDGGAGGYGGYGGFGGLGGYGGSAYTDELPGGDSGAGGEGGQGGNGGDGGHGGGGGGGNSIAILSDDLERVSVVDAEFETGAGGEGGAGPGEPGTAGQVLDYWEGAFSR